MSLLAASIYYYISHTINVVLVKGFEHLFFLHPFTTYITILLHMQAELILKLWYAADGPNKRQKAAMLHSSVSAGVLVLFFGLNTWVGYLRRHEVLWWPLSWQFPNFVLHRNPPYWPSFHSTLVNALVGISCYFIAYHVVAFGISLWTNFRTTSSHDAAGAEGAEVALEYWD